MLKAKRVNGKNVRERKFHVRIVNGETIEVSQRQINLGELSDAVTIHVRWEGTAANDTVTYVLTDKGNGAAEAVAKLDYPTVAFIREAYIGSTILRGEWNF